MATILTLDTYTFVEGLKEAGIPEKQAVAIADGFKLLNLENVATKHDVVELRVAIQQVKADIFKWSVPILLGQAALTATLVKLIS